MVRTTLYSGFLGLTLALSSPALAQDADQPAQDSTAASEGTEELDEMMAMLSGMFSTEPLTAEQEARLPLAQQIISKMIPEGTMSEMMGGMFDDMFGPIMAMAGPASNATVAEQIGIEAPALDLDEDQSAELADIFDPAWEERSEREMALLPEMMSGMMTAMEPGMRKAMSELYAINFSSQQLSEIDAFFSTETGTEFARKSFTMASDPRVVAASMESLPVMMEMLGGMEAKAQEQTADLPAMRTFSELTAEEQARVTELTGYSAEEIEANLAAAEATE